MKTLITIAALALATLPALAAETGPRGAQQSKMATCNKEAVGKKGDERKAFMKACLKGGTAAPAATTAAATDKTKQCNAEAKGKTGDARKAFMKACLG